MELHTEAVAPAIHPVPSSASGQRFILHGVSWATYERLLADFVDSHQAHFTYDRGALEIMAPAFEHEKTNRLIHDLFSVIADEMNIDFINAGSTTFKREDLASGFEPDTCFYIQNADRLRGKEEIDLTVDPPPDLVIEIDMTSSSLNKLPIYTAVGVPEVWRYNGKRTIIYVLAGKSYKEQEESAALPHLTSTLITDFIHEGKRLERRVWLRKLREWVRGQ